MKQFDIPIFYRSPIISRVKSIRKSSDPRKQDFSPTMLDFGPVRFVIARHFGFCYGVENAIEISYRAIEENPGKRIFLLSEMIHNPEVNRDLQERGIRFLQDTSGNTLIPWEELNSEDIVIVPAFGTTVEIEQKLSGLDIETQTYDTTCPFVKKVWKRAGSLGEDNYTVVVHGKASHEETRATFSHSRQNAPTVIVRDLADTKMLAEIILGKRPIESFSELFAGKFSPGFDAEKHLSRVGVVNQTTMLASETAEIAEYLKETMLQKYGEEQVKAHFADTRDTLCYATNDNQKATLGLMKREADLAVVVGGYNSSNTSHLVELLEDKFPTYYISTAGEIQDQEMIHHFDFHNKEMLKTNGYLPSKDVVDIVLSSGASCPDAQVDEVMQKLLGYFPGHREVDVVLKELEKD